jgi:O-antigen ligase
MAGIASLEKRGRFDLDPVFGLFVLFLLVDLYLVLDPFYSGWYEFRVTRDLGPVKYAGLFVGLCACALGLAGTALTRGALPRTILSGIWTGWPITLLATYMFLGSLYARVVLDTQQTFLPVSLGMLGFPIAVILFSVTRAPNRLIAGFFWALLAASPYAMAWIARKRVEGGQAFHTEIFLVVPVAVYFFRAIKNRWFAWLVVISMVITGLATNKLTGYVVLLLTLLCLVLPVVARSLRRGRVVDRSAALYALTLAALLFAAGVGFLYFNHEQYLPSGSPDLRLRTYSNAWLAFRASPMYGDAFTGPTIQWIVGLHVLGEPRVPTHSDLLDILSHGGVIGLLLFVVGLYRVLGPAFRGAAPATSSTNAAQEQGLVAIVLCGVFVAAFNVPFGYPQISTLFWFATGLLAALHVSNERRYATEHVGHEGARHVTTHQSKVSR